MFQIVRSYRQGLPALRFMGIRYGDGDRVNGGFGARWEEWFSASRFEALERLADDGFRNAYAEYGAYLGLMRWKEGEPFQYWIGMFAPEGTPIPDGYGFIDFPEGQAGICWVKGGMNGIFGKEKECLNRLSADGFKAKADKDGAFWFFERYACPRFTTPAADGTVILDIGWLVE